MRHHHARGGNDRLLELLLAPPSSSAMILKPERYDPAAGPTRRGDLAGLEGEFGPGPWTVERRVLSALDLRARWAALEPEVLTRVFDGLVGGARLGALAPDGEVYAAASVIRFTDAATAEAVYASLTPIASITFEGPGGTLQPEELTAQRVTSERLAGAVRLGYVVRPTPDRAHRFVLLHACRGPLVVQLMAVNFPIPDERLVDLADQALRRFEE